MAPEEPLGVTRTLSQRPVEEDGVDDYAVVAAILAVVLICIIIVIVIYSYCQRHSVMQWCRHYVCPCHKRNGASEGILTMGYLPANITVNPAALEQGVPDIFLRDSQAGRYSMDPYSFDSSRSTDSVTETSGAWAEYLRRATFSRRGGGDRGDRQSVDRLPSDPGPFEREHGSENEDTGVTNWYLHDDVKNGTLHDDDVTLQKGIINKGCEQ